MDVKQAKDLVFERVCREYKERGDDARVYWRALPDELEIPPEIFQGAIESFVEAGGGIGRSSLITI